MMEGLRTSAEVIVIVVTLLSYGCPIQAIVHAYGLDERTVTDWQKRAGKHCHQVHQAIVAQGKVETHHVQADEIRAKMLFRGVATAVYRYGNQADAEETGGGS